MSDEVKSSPVEITVPRVACPLHGEPFRAKWPKGWVQFSLSMIQAVLSLEEFRAEVGNNFVPAVVEAALDRKPACERLPADAIERLYKDCGVGAMGICVVCFKPAMGTPMRSIEQGKERYRRHVCFSCVLQRYRRHGIPC